MSLSRRSFIKKSSYSAAAVTILGAGVALANGNSSGEREVDHITRWTFPENILTSKNGEFTPEDKEKIENDPTYLQFYDHTNGDGSPPPWLPTANQPDSGYPTKQTVQRDEQYLMSSYITIPNPLIIHYKPETNENNNPTGQYLAFIPSHTIEKEDIWGNGGAGATTGDGS